jgi:hypothetical protein
MRNWVMQRSGVDALRAVLLTVVGLPYGNQTDPESSHSNAQDLFVDNTRWARNETTIAPQNVGKLGVK